MELTSMGFPLVGLTYCTWTFLQIIPAPGWHGVFYEDAEGYDHAPDNFVEFLPDRMTLVGGHFMQPLHFLALVDGQHHLTPGAQEAGYRFFADARWQDKEPPPLRDIVGVAYDCGVREWQVCNDFYNFCGLLPPGVPLDVFGDHHASYVPCRQEYRRKVAVIRV
jgi:hypothetical protein